MIIHPFTARFPKPNLPMSDQEFFEAVSNQFTLFVKQKVFTSKQGPGFYIYKIEGKYPLIGIVAGLDIHEIIDGNILSHEQTIIAKESQMSQLLSKRKAMIKPVLLAYDQPKSITTWINEFIDTKKPILKMSSEGENYLLWLIEDLYDIAFLKDQFQDQIKAAYIADGHHRIATALSRWKRYGRQDKIMCLFTDLGTLKVHAYHRLVQLTDDMTIDDLIKKLANFAQVDAISALHLPTEKYHFAIHSQNKSWLCQWKKNIIQNHDNEVVKLDVQWINTYILGEILGIEDVTASPKLSYIDGTHDTAILTKQVNLIDNQIGIFMYPIDIHDIVTVADNQLSLPPKSTWFEPRIKNGLITMDLKKS